MGERYVCVHGHFYQPPRENPWLDAIESQPSARPYHDWNARITAECYATNACSRVLAAQGRIRAFENNYSRIGFNFGPTLLEWLERERPDVHASIVRADALSMRRFGGHGAALAQVYNHLIMPLATRRDRRTQILWGLRDFERRFGRKAQGMWLAETAADTETLSLLAECGVTFTILAPNQAARVRPLHDRDALWQPVQAHTLDPTRAYLQKLPGHRSIALFFYDGPISRAVAFEGLLDRGEKLANRLLGALVEREEAQLVHIATDGETYGHHHTHGEMALSFALDALEREEGVRPTIHAEFLALHPPQWEVELREDTSWSCAHGVERWRADCGCHTGGEAGWNQAWRAPLRAALDGLGEELARGFEQVGDALFHEPWEARDAYIEVLLGAQTQQDFLARHARRVLSEEEQRRALELLEMQRHAMLMYTSCGWFFNDLAGIETLQILEYAARALQLAVSCLGKDLEPEFLQGLERARSNISEEGSGKDIYIRHVRASMYTLRDIAAHHVLCAAHGVSPCSKAHSVDYSGARVVMGAGVELAYGQAEVFERATRARKRVTYGSVRAGSTARAWVREEEVSAQVWDRAERLCVSGEAQQAWRLLEDVFGEQRAYGLQQLPRDDRALILGVHEQRARAAASEAYRTLYEGHVEGLAACAPYAMRLPEELEAATRFALWDKFKRLLCGSQVHAAQLVGVVEEAARFGIKWEDEAIQECARAHLDALVMGWRSEPYDEGLLEQLVRFLGVCEDCGIEVNRWRAQDAWAFVMRRQVREAAGSMAERPAWKLAMKQLAERLDILMSAAD